MVKQGPCCHCGVTDTPLWRNGPPNKPVLCNACGSRWRTKGSLTNYVPLHSRVEPAVSVNFKNSTLSDIPGKIKEQKFAKRKWDEVSQESENGGTAYDPQNEKLLEEVSCNWSSSGSVLSNSESSSQLYSADASDFTGASLGIVWDIIVPSRKRTRVSHPKPKASPVEKLSNDLYCILQEQESSYLSGSSEEDLIFERENPMVSVETGHGGFLIKHPTPILEEESEDGSLVIHNKGCIIGESYSTSLSLPVPTTPSEGMDSPGISKEKMDRAMAQQFNDFQNTNAKMPNRLQSYGAMNLPLQNFGRDSSARH